MQHIIQTSNNLPMRNDNSQDIDCKSLLSIINMICPSCLNHNVLVLKLLRMLHWAFRFVGQIAYH